MASSGIFIPAKGGQGNWFSESGIGYKRNCLTNKTFNKNDN